MMIRQDAGARTLRDFNPVMQICEASMVHQLLNIESGDRLETTKQLVNYLTKGIPESDEESFFIACMNPKRRPICRTHIKTAVLVTCRISTADVFLPLLLAEACQRSLKTGQLRSLQNRPL